MVSILIFVFQLCLFASVIVAFHWMSPRLGLSPFIFLVAGMVALMNIIELNFLLIRPFAEINQIELRPGGHVYVPLILLVVLLLYVANGTRPAQVMLYGIVGINFLVFVALGFLSMYLTFKSPDTVLIGGLAENNPFDLFFIRGMLASITAFAANMFVIIIVYQGMVNAFPSLPHWIAPFVALVLALWTDSAVYNLGAFLGTERFILQVPSDTIMKTLAGLIVAPFASIYLARIAPALPEFVGVKGRPTFDILFRNGQKESALETLETELRISRSIYRQLTQNIEEIFWLVDVETRRFLYISPAFERITGYDVEAFYKDAERLSTIVHPDDRLIREGNVMRFLLRNRESEIRVIRPDKLERVLRLRSFEVKDDAGEVIRYAGVAEDITEKKRISEHAFELALAEERMRILHNFVRDASHDLKSPISAMMLKIGLLEKVTDEERRQAIRLELKDRAMHLSDLIDDLFTLSRIEGHDSTALRELNLNEVAQKVSQQMQPLAEAKSLQFEVKLCDEPCLVAADKEQLERLINNLLSNAIRYTNTGKVSLQTWQDADGIHIEVADTGIGIPQTELGNIFQRFFRASSAQNANISGTGLGLAIAKAIVERHSGQIEVISDLGKGSRFQIRFPVFGSEQEDTVDEKRTEHEFHALSDE